MTNEVKQVYKDNGKQENSNFDQIKVRKTVDIDVKEIYYAHFQSADNDNIFYVKPMWDLYKAEIGPGNHPIYIMSDYYEKIPIGKQELCIRPMVSVEVESMLENMRKKEPELFEELIKKELKIQMKESKKTEAEYKSWRDINQEVIEKHFTKQYFFVLDDQVNLEILSQCSNEELLHFVTEYLTGGAEFDPRLVYAFRTGLLIPSFQVFEPIDVQKYRGHKIILTNPKVGKTTLSRKVGINIETATRYNLLGGGTADREQVGALNQQSQEIALEEISDEKTEGLHTHMNTIEEQGDSRIGRGVGTRTKTHSAIVYLGNVKNLTENPLVLQDELLLNFNKILRIMTDNYEAFGSRKALTLFGVHFKPVRGIGLPKEEERKYEAIFYTLRKNLSKNYSLLLTLERTREILSEEYPEEYKEKLQKLINSCEDNNEIKAFIRGHLESFKHLNGLALSQFLMENLNDLLTTNDLKSLSGLLDIGHGSVQDHKKILRDMNLESFKQIITILSNEETKEIITQNNYNRLPIHLKMIIRSVEKLKIDKEKVLSIYELKEEVINSIKEYSIDINSPIISSSNVWKRAYRDSIKSNLLLDYFGIYLLAKERINVKKKFSRVSSLLPSVQKSRSPELLLKSNNSLDMGQKEDLLNLLANWVDVQRIYLKFGTNDDNGYYKAEPILREFMASGDLEYDGNLIRLKKKGDD